jgi:glycosyltransferase involved in cell wall biosynthesis
MPAAYMLATVVVSASIEPEGFGRVPVESQAMGRPTIATDHGGARETIIRGETGWLVPPANATALARAIQEALALEPMQRAVLATRAMSHIAQSFTRNRMVDKTLDIYADLIRTKISGTFYNEKSNAVERSPKHSNPDEAKT